MYSGEGLKRNPSLVPRLLVYPENVELDGLQNRLSQILKMLLSRYTHILLVLFCWRTLTKT